MMIKTEGMPLHEQVFEVLRANYFLNDAADFSRHMGRSRTYLSTTAIHPQVMLIQTFSAICVHAMTKQKTPI